VSLQGRDVEDERHPLPVRWDGLWGKCIEANDSLFECPKQWNVVGSVGEPFVHAVQEHAEVTPHNIVFRGVVPEERPAGDPGGDGDVLYGGRGEAIPDEEVQSDLLEFCAAGDRRSTWSVAVVAGSRHRLIIAHLFTLAPGAINVRRYFGSPEGSGGSMPDDSSSTDAVAIVDQSAGEENLVEEELLVEDVSIDGMCGVY